MWQLDPRGNQRRPTICNTANEIPRLEDTGIVPHYLPGQNPEADFMIRTFNLPERGGDGVRGDAVSGVPQEDQGQLHAACRRAARYCCGWIERRAGRAARPVSPATTAASVLSVLRGATQVKTQRRSSPACALQRGFPSREDVAV